MSRPRNSSANPFRGSPRGLVAGLFLCLAGLTLTGIGFSGTAWAQRANRPADAPNPVHLDTVPAGAKVRVDGQVVKDPDETTLLLSPGAHTIHVSKGNLAARARVNVVQGEASYLKLEMTPQDASLRVESDPEGAEVKVDGKSAGKTPVTLKLPAGAHQIDIEQVGYPALNAPVDLDAGWETTMQVELAREVAGESVWNHPSTWDNKRRAAVGLGALLIVYGITEAEAVNTSNSRQDQLRSDAQNASDLPTYQSFVSQIQKERKRGLAHQQNAEAGYGAGALAIALSFLFDGPKEGVRGSKVEVTSGAAPDGTPLLALQWGF